MASGDSIDLEPFTLAELEQLAKRVAEEITRKRAAGRQWLQQHGARIPGTDTPKYQNPNNAAQTWSGKGKQPGWVEELLARGKTLADLLAESTLPASRPRSGDREGGR